MHIVHAGKMVEFSGIAGCWLVICRTRFRSDVGIFCAILQEIF